LSCSNITSKTIVPALIISLSLFFTSANAGDQWDQLRNRADELYGGFDISAKIRTGYQANTGLNSLDDLETKSGPYGKFEIEMPLYSKADRIRNNLDKTAFLKQGAELIRQINENTESVKLLKSKADVMQAVMKDEGVKGIEAYYNVLQEISTKENLVKEAQMKLEAMLK
jgi:hypothetical protein